MKSQNIIHLLFIALFILSAFGYKAFAQQDPMYSQYMFNGLALNPAYAGSKGYLTTTFLHRNQWVDIQGAPKTNILSFHTPLLIESSSIGATLLHDRIGVTSRTDLYGTYAYRIQLNKGAKLAFGLRAGMTHYRIDFTQLTYWDSDDPIYNNGNQRGVAPNVGTGIYFQTNKFYAGLSVPNLLSYNPEESFSVNAKGIPTTSRHYFGTIGYAIEINPNFVLKPSLMAKYESSAPFQLDVNLNMLLARKVWVGASYRTSDAIVGMVEFIPIPMLQVGYAYDYTLSELAAYTRGTHELVLTLNFGSQVSKLKTPRYF